MGDNMDYMEELNLIIQERIAILHHQECLCEHAESILERVRQNQTASQRELAYLVRELEILQTQFADNKGRSYERPFLFDPEEELYG